MDIPYPFVINEYDHLKKVVVGIADGLGPTPVPEACYDPKSREHVLSGTYPQESDLKAEIDNLAQVFEEHGVEVIRPDEIRDYNQIFSRDIGFVIDDKFIISQMIEERSREIDALDSFIDELPSERVISMGGDAFLEGGDIILHNDHIFIGYSNDADFEQYTVARTNLAGVQFIRMLFPAKTIHAFELNKSDDDPRVNALHLDCCFQPLGLGQCIIHNAGFKHEEDIKLIHSIFGEENCITVDQQEMYEMGCNVFSVSPDTVLSEAGFTRINDELRKRGYIVVEIPYSETAKLEGLLRCSTLPIQRTRN